MFRSELVYILFFQQFVDSLYKAELMWRSYTTPHEQ